MRGEFLNVWEDAIREIWIPLAEQEGVPEDLFSQLYLELFTAFTEPSGDWAQDVPLGDSIQLREAFHRALSLAGAGVELASADEAFAASGATAHEDLRRRRHAVEESLERLIGDKVTGSRLLRSALAELAQDSERRAEARARARDAIVNDKNKSRQAFLAIRSVDIAGERVLVAFIESAFEIVDDVGGERLSNGYFNLVAAFIEKFSLRYDLRRPCTVCPTLPGVFASLVRDLRAMTAQDGHLDELMKDFEESVRDLRIDCSERRIKTCIQKQINLLEAVGRAYPRVRRKTLGAISRQIATWPHEEVRTALQSLYGFTCDYPGIRHGGSRENALRSIDMRDMLAISILLMGFTPYLNHALNADVVYRGA